MSTLRQFPLVSLLGVGVLFLLSGCDHLAASGFGLNSHELPSELPSRSEPELAGPELEEFMTRSIRVITWAVSGPVTAYVADDNGNVDWIGDDGNSHQNIPHSILLGGKVNSGSVLANQHYVIHIVQKDEGQFVFTLGVQNTLDENIYEIFDFHYGLVNGTARTEAWIDIPAGVWTVIPALYVDVEGDGDIDLILEPTMRHVQIPVPE